MNEAPSPGQPDQGAPPAGPTADDDDGEDMAENELCVPLSSLAMPGEDDAMEKPEVGDKGQANVEYTVSRIDGDNAYVTVDAVNGNKIAQPAGPPTEDEQMDQLRQMAEGMPERY